MKIYLNSELSLKEYHYISSELLKISDAEEDFIRLPTLNKRNLINTVLGLLEPESDLIVYDFMSLGLTLRELLKLNNALEQKKVSLVFLKESKNFLKTALEFAVKETAVLASRKHYIAETEAPEKKLVGRPKISEAQKDKIWVLYQQNCSMREIAKIVGVSLGTVSKYVKRMSE